MESNMQYFNQKTNFSLISQKIKNLLNVINKNQKSWLTWYIAWLCLLRRCCSVTNCCQASFCPCFMSPLRPVREGLRSCYAGGADRGPKICPMFCLPHLIYIYIWMLRYLWRVSRNYKNAHFMQKSSLTDHHDKQWYTSTNLWKQTDQTLWNL